MKNEERGVATDPPQPEEPAEKSEEQSSHVPLWLIVLAVLALVIGLIVYSYKDWPGAQYFGSPDKGFWDYLKLLIVPAALAIGCTGLTGGRTNATAKLTQHGNANVKPKKLRGSGSVKSTQSRRSARP